CLRRREDGRRVRHRLVQKERKEIVAEAEMRRGVAWVDLEVAGAILAPRSQLFHGGEQAPRKGVCALDGIEIADEDAEHHREIVEITGEIPSKKRVSESRPALMKQ